MNKMMLRVALATTAASGFFVMPSAADAAIVASLGTGSGQLQTLSQAGLAGGAVATLVGGTVYTTDQPFADIPKGGLFGGTFLAAGPLAGAPATLLFTAPTTYLSFLWGSPDTYNVLTLTTTQGISTYTAAGLNFAVTDGNQTFSQYVQFAATMGDRILSVSFNNLPQRDAFESANFSVSAIPEPSTWAMMLVGFGMVAGTARYRRRHATVIYS